MEAERKETRGTKLELRIGVFGVFAVEVEIENMVCAKIDCAEQMHSTESVSFCPSPPCHFLFKHIFLHPLPFFGPFKFSKHKLDSIAEQACSNAGWKKAAAKYSHEETSSFDAEITFFQYS